MDFSPLTIIKSGKNKSVFPVSTCNKSQDSWLDLLWLPSKSSWPPALWGIGRRCLQKMVLNIHHHGGLSPVVQKLPDLRDKDKWWVKKLLCSLTLGHRWILPTLQTLRTAITKSLNEVIETTRDSSSFNSTVKINLISLYWILNLLFRRSCEESRHQQQSAEVERGSDFPFQTFLLQTSHI